MVHIGRTVRNVFSKTILEDIWKVHLSIKDTVVIYMI